MDSLTEILDIAAASTKAAAIYFIALILVRLGKKRLIQHLSAFDFIITIILGSTLSRCINGSAPILPTVAAGAVIVLLHYVFSLLCYHFAPVQEILEGRPHRLVKDGKIQWENMRSHHISETDLYSELRKSGVESIDKVKNAYFEPSGNISFILK